MIKKIKKIIIFGGGTSGWLSAAFLAKNLNHNVEITLIEDTEQGPIGVGEGTQPFTAKFLSQCGIPPLLWMKNSNATFKYGVELIGWNEEPYFVDNDTPDNALIAQDFYTSDYFIGKPYTKFLDWHPAYQLAKKNICQKYDDYLDVNFGMSPINFGAVHFGAYDLIKTIKNLILDKIKYVDIKIKQIKTNENGIEALIDEKETEYAADLFIDCTGFSSILLEKEFKVPFLSYNDFLLNDRAVVIRTRYTDPKQQCHPYTKATTMDSGWMFTIPTFSSIGNGYVYSSKYISDEEAETELRSKIGELVAPARFIKMKCGTHKEIAIKNVCAVGLSAGFVEPLEATGITFTTSVISNLTGILNSFNNVWGDQQRTIINEEFSFMCNEIFTFIWSHYHFSSKNNTPYWKDIRNQKIEDLPPMSKEILGLFLPIPKRFMQVSPNSMFNVVQWFSLLHAGGAYNGVKSALTEKQEKYAEYFLNVHKCRLELAESMFLNHYEYLTEWYKDD
jgi:hypothetical protein